MARNSLTNSSSKLNLSRRQAAVLQDAIIAGNGMAVLLNDSYTKKNSSKR